MNNSIKPGKIWLDTEGKRIQAHGGSILTVDGKFYWYGENKEHTKPGTKIWHWGIRCYSSEDLYNWKDEGIICPPDPENPDSPMNPEHSVDRPHILYNEDNKQYVMWMKEMESGGRQCMNIAVSDKITGPYKVVKAGIHPLSMNSGDFDLVKAEDGKAYIYFERVHSELICADLTPDYMDVTGYYSTHFPASHPPFVREAPAVFRKKDKLYMFTSGTTGYFPNPSEVAGADTYHGTWQVLGDPHIDGRHNDSYCSQISSVFKHPYKKDLYIALADRWLVDLPKDMPDIIAAFDSHFDKDKTPTMSWNEILSLSKNDTSIADYVWLPVYFKDGMPVIKWHDEWKIEDFD
ncbi:MAG: family 43 glycosylhydrolase [Bacillota bacterium]|nr:family 43 glycosylhydrolase [Bacillota bacterium]